MRTLAVIPARMGSTRFPGKPLAPLRGKPLVQHAWEAARRVPGVERTVVATDDEAIASVVRGFGGEPVMTSPRHPTGSDRAAEAAAALGDFEAVAVVQGDEPLLAPPAVAQALDALAADPEAGIATLAWRDDDPRAFAARDVVKVVTTADGAALFFSRAPIGEPVAGRAAGWSYLRHVGIYVYRAHALAEFARAPQSELERAEALEQLRALERGIRIRVVVTNYRSVAVDTPQDLETVEREWTRLGGESTAAATARPGGEPR